MKYFTVLELVDKATYEHLGDEAIKLFHPDALDALEGVREFFGKPLTVNTWSYRPDGWQYRGYRPQGCAVGAMGSYHRKGMAFDFDVSGLTADVVRGMILEHQDDPLLSKVMRLEAAVSWVHMDIMPVEHRIYVFKV
jgi:uncharacterized protein YcbK (DUF882 family)